MAVLPLPGAGTPAAACSALASTRRRDVARVVVRTGEPGHPGRGTETVVEVNHQYNVASWLAVTPDFQYVWRPGGLSVVGSAVAGVQVVPSP